MPRNNITLQLGKLLVDPPYCTRSVYYCEPRCLVPTSQLHRYASALHSRVFHIFTFLTFPRFPRGFPCNFSCWITWEYSFSRKTPFWPRPPLVYGTPFSSNFRFWWISQLIRRAAPPGFHLAYGASFAQLFIKKWPGHARSRSYDVISGIASSQICKK